MSIISIQSSTASGQNQTWLDHAVTKLIGNSPWERCRTLIQLMPTPRVTLAFIFLETSMTTVPCARDAFCFSLLTSAPERMLLWISKPRTFSESQLHPSCTAPGKGAEEIINFTTSCKITCFSGPWKAGAGNVAYVLVMAQIFCLLLLFL